MNRPKLPLRKPEPTADLLLKTWRTLSAVPGGSRAFSAFVGRMAPYTATMGARVVELSPGFARVQLTERHKVRNHLRSIHAVALVNLVEMCSGLAMLSGLPPGTRGIVTELRTEYLKKARGTVTATARAPEVTEAATADHDLTIEVHDEGGALVARGTARWRIGATGG